MSKTNTDLEEYLKANPPNKVGDYERIAQQFNTNPELVRYYCRKNKVQISRNVEDYSKLKSSCGRTIDGKEVEKKEVPKKTTLEEYAEKVIEKLQNKTLDPYDRITSSPVICNPNGDPEEMVLILSDWQLGHKTRTFSLNVAKERVSKLVHSVKAITDKERKSHKVEKLNIFLLGDFVQNELIGRFVDLSELEAILIDQVFDHAVPLLSGTLAELATCFPQINVYCVRGNHGSGDKMNSEKTNWDDVIYKVLAMKFENNPQITFHLTREFYSIADIQGWSFLMAHGDQVRGGSYSIPLYSLLQRMLRWGTALPEKWDVLCVGHWHCFGYMDQNNQSLLVNGTLVSDDDYVRRRYGWESSTIQLLFGVHEKRPITSLYKIDFK